jgi:hypothetical protein
MTPDSVGPALGGTGFSLCENPSESPLFIAQAKARATHLPRR